MSIVKIRYTDGTWINICSCKLMQSGGTWSNAIKNGDKILYNGVWVTVDCIVVTPCGGVNAFDGGQSYPSQQIITLGSGLGLVTLNYDSVSVPDKFQVFFNNALVINTGYRGDVSHQPALDTELASRGLPSELINSPGSGIITFNKTTNHSTAIVKVFAPLSGTAWSYTLSCPV